MAGWQLAGGEASGIPLFRIFGIEIRLDWSVLIIFGLIVYSLGAVLFPQWHPDWSAATSWSTGLLAGLIFFASLLAHELSHSLVARRFGIRVPRITLFLLGGMAEIESEARTPREELLIAAAGPLMSLALGVMFTVIVGVAVGAETLDVLATQPEAALATMSPLVTASVWLGSVNIMLAVFNMIPGFPLDGGRVFRAALWWSTGDALWATRIASAVGRLVGWLIVAWGVWNLLARHDPGGLWLILIGWFLTHIARASYTQMVTERNLRSMRVADVMRTRFDSIPADMSVERFIEDHLLRSSQRLWPVTEGDRHIGTVTFDDVAAVAGDERVHRQVRDLMTPLDKALTLDSTEMATTALRRLGSQGDHPVAVMADGRIVGLVAAADIVRWTLLHLGHT